MISINVQSNFKQVAVKMFELRRDVLEKAKIRALNKVAAQAKVAASKEIRAAGYNMKAADIKQRSTGLNRDGKACRVPSSRKTIGKT
jgi:hypothetical protein